MNKTIELALKVARKTYTSAFNKNALPECIQDANKVSNMIYSILTKNEPCMIARFGSTELNAISNYIGIKEHKNDIIGYITGKSPQWWWNQKGLNEMYSCSGFFPPTVENISKFSQLMINDMSLVDILGSWRPQELLFKNELRNCEFVHLRLLEPFWSDTPWTKALQNQKVLVVHPFASTIIKQYERRKLLFNNTDILPSFKEIHIIKAVQSLGGDDKRFRDWFEALEWMKKEIDKVDYDICLIGCGAYGFPLAAHIKRKGKKAIHLGGSLQLLFGIKGKRWEDPNYGVKEWKLSYGCYTALMNNFWVRPGKEGMPQNAQQVEDGCYW